VRDEERQDEVARRQGGLANHCAEGVGAAESPESGCWKDGHRPALLIKAVEIYGNRWVFVEIVPDLPSQSGYPASADKPDWS
jgi:hypothetical protein